MKYDELQRYFNHHCRIKLRSGKEVFGVLWEGMNNTEKAIYFASYVEHKKLMSNNIHSPTPRSVPNTLSMTSEEILGIETILA